MDVYNDKNELLTTGQIKEQLNKIQSKARTISVPGIGILTAENRNTWGSYFEKLKFSKQNFTRAILPNFIEKMFFLKMILVSPQNQRNLELIERSIASICLDKAMPTDGKDSFRFKLYYKKIIKINIENFFSLGINQMNHGGGSKLNSGNRWFDKTLQFIISEDGQVGLTYEHSSAEGPPIVSILDHALFYA